MEKIKKRPVDKVRASRDGHEYHEIWVARKSLELLNPNSALKVLAVEGLSPIDQKSAKNAEVEIADVALYYGGKVFETSSSVIIIQFKYSIAYKDMNIKVSAAKKTLEKFSETYKNHIKRFGSNAPKKLRFQFITNRPVSSDFVKTVKNLTVGVKNTGKYLALENQLKKATKLKGNELKEFASICEFFSYTNNLSLSKNELENTLVSLSATSDAIATSRLGKLKELVRNKAGTSGDGKNTIEHVDILAALSVRDISDLLPCPEVLSNWGKTLDREQFIEFVKAISSTKKTILIHATGGVGKTVIMKSLANKFSENHEVIFFDSFGGGSYRSKEDARHLAKHGLIHIANTLAFRGLCDPILPNTPDDQALAKTFRHRLEQCTETFKKANSKRMIYIFIDAIDNAELAAKQNGQIAFSKILLESFHDKPIQGVKLIVSCRSERKPTTYAKYDEIKLKSFSKKETIEFLKDRIKKPKAVFIDYAFTRSGGNARVLEYLIESKGKVDTEKSKLNLDYLISQKIEKAIESAMKKGTSENDLTTFLSGLALLEPPVSIEDYSLANGVDSNAITSMISDLAPLLELTKYGVKFRDEPAETLIIKKYGSKIDDLKKIAKNLFAIQDQSVFAAKTLPDLLYRLKDGNGIYDLANDSRIPSSIESDVGKLKIRYSRLNVAIKYAAEEKNFDKLIGFLVEISSLSEFDQRGLYYLLNYPELVAEIGDSDAIRRIYDARTAWPGTRLAWLAITHTLLGELEEAHVYVDSLTDWVNHYLRINNESRNEFNSKMEATDCVAEPLFLLAKKSPKLAANYFSRWKDWYSFEVATQLYCLHPLSSEKRIIDKKDFSVFNENLNSVGALLATSFFCYNRKNINISLLKKLASLLKNRTIEFPDSLTFNRTFLFQKCFLYASLNSIRGKDKKTAKTILDALGDKRPRIFEFKEPFQQDSLTVVFLIRVVIRSIILGKRISFLDILPSELFKFGKLIKKKEDSEVLKELKSNIENYLKNSIDEPNKRINDRDKREYEDFLNRRLQQLYTLAVSLRRLLEPFNGNAKTRLNNLIETWENLSKPQESYRESQIDWLWLKFGYEVIIFSLFTLKNIKSEDLNKLLSSQNLQNIDVSSKISMIHAFSVLFPTDKITGETAIKFSKQIEGESDVSTKSTYYAGIARSLLLVSNAEAIEYFKKGQLSVDAIGSGDYRYVNELLIFSASLHGKEMAPSEFHSLNDICELNMNEEPDKFYWVPYSAAFSKIAGLCGIAQLSRWDDRQVVDLAHTLLPSLIALTRDKKLSIKDAIALNYLALPVEYHIAGTAEFIETLSSVGLSVLEVKELIHQFNLNNSGISMNSAVKALVHISEKVLGKSAPETKELKSLFSTNSILIDQSNRRRNLNSSLENDKFRKQHEKKKKENEKLLIKRIRKTNPANIKSFKIALKVLNRFEYPFDMKDAFFSAIRKNVKYQNYNIYIKNLVSIKDGELPLIWVIDELNKCYETWSSTSISLKKSFREAGLVLLHQYFGDNYIELSKISMFSGISVPDIAHELVKIGSQHNFTASSTVCLSLAALLNEKASDNVGQLALKKILEKESTAVSELASDELYKHEFYPANNTDKIIASLIWKVLGSFDAKQRWRAGHAIRCFAKFDRWEVISELMNMIANRDAGVFQCPKIKFYDYHARLWLLISMARLAIDFPTKVAMYKSQIEPFIKVNHVLFRHFAGKILLECHKANNSFLTEAELKYIAEINHTQKPLEKELSSRLDFYKEKPDKEPAAIHEYSLDYDFMKMHVDSLGIVFNVDCWKMNELIADSAYEIDPSISRYSDTGNKSFYPRAGHDNAHKQLYGEQVAWHALLITAGKLLVSHSVTEGYRKENSWNEWLSSYILTREDGFWQSDAIDIIPLEIKNLLLEVKESKLVLTENRDVLLGLINFKKKFDNDVIIDGHWHSKDGVDVEISSALVPKKHSHQTVNSLSKDNPFQIWLPDLTGEDEGARLGVQCKYNLVPWIVSTESYAKLDEFDPYRANINRDSSRISKKIIDAYKLKCTDKFKKFWYDENCNVVLKSEIWRGPNSDDREAEYSGLRLSCSSEFLKKVLKDHGENLIILIRLQYYIKPRYDQSSGEFQHSIGIVEINEKLEVKYFKGCNK